MIPAAPPSNSRQEREAELELTHINVDSSTVSAMSSHSESSDVAVESRHQDIAVLSKDAFEPNHEAARKMLGSLLLSYPGVLSIESRYEVLSPQHIFDALSNPHLPLIVTM